ncbi:hypothetical protein AVEN_147003-1 [Araneus ventricosus]|uniref:Uncharacterized protein n=1 Tax=Araneus ventricosus TaxID=182803 RepID=A0A4Y2LBH1_ARAVE|nr:hypothetical protein AVEN_147003-1 [Araneus ventricosus]
MGAEGPHADRKTARMVISLEGFCSWKIMQDPTQQGTQKYTFLPLYERDWIIRPTDPFPALKSALSGHLFQSNGEVLQAVKIFPRSLGTDFYQDGFLKLISGKGIESLSNQLPSKAEISEQHSFQFGQNCPQLDNNRERRSPQERISKLKEAQHILEEEVFFS